TLSHVGGGAALGHAQRRLAVAYALQGLREQAVGARGAAGAPERGAEKIAEAHRIAHRLGARPLAMRAAEELRRIGQPVERLLGRRVAGRMERGGLSRREVAVLA